MKISPEKATSSVGWTRLLKETKDRYIPEETLVICEGRCQAPLISLGPSASHMFLSVPSCPGALGA